MTLVKNCYDYDAFGNVLESKTEVENHILYRGQQYDQETGQYYLRARYYNPVVGRFTQEDIYRGDGLNLYAYCENNPVIYYDPSGYDKATLPTMEPERPKTGSEGGSKADFYVTPEGSAIPHADYHSLSDLDARKWYLSQEATIPDLIDYSQPLEQQAYQAFSLRNKFRTTARELMANRELAESLYKTDPNRTWQEMIQRQVEKGLAGDDIYKAIIQSSQRSRTSVNKLLGLE